MVDLPEESEQEPDYSEQLKQPNTEGNGGVQKKKFPARLVRSKINQTCCIHSDEGLTLETSIFESFTVANLPYRPYG